MAIRRYELLVILDPARTEEEQQQTIQSIDDVVTKYGGTPVVDDRRILGKRRLAFSIAGRREGYYVANIYETETTNEVLSEVDRHCKYSDHILRHLMITVEAGKSKGDPSLADQAYARQQQASSFRGGPRGDRGGDRRPPRDYRSDAPAAPGAPAAAAPAAPAAVEGATEVAEKPAEAPATTPTPATEE